MSNVEVIRSDMIAGTYAPTVAHATKANGFVFVTGTVANAPGSTPAHDPLAPVDLGGLEEQVTQAMENLKAILEEAGTDLEHVVKRNFYITHVTDYEIVHRVLSRYFETPVASTAIVCDLIPHSCRFEIDVTAVLP